MWTLNFCAFFAESNDRPDLHANLVASLLGSSFQHLKTMRGRRSYWRRDRVTESSTICVRKLHNFVKLQVLKLVDPSGARVLELAAGRGVDIYKHQQLGVAHVTYVDSDSVAMAAFQQVYATTMQSPNFRVDFCLVDLLQAAGLSVLSSQLPEQVDLVCLQFALHYFLGTPASLQLIFSYIDSFLKVGGQFIFSGVDGRLLNSRFSPTRGVYTVHGADKRQPIASYTRRYQPGNWQGLGNQVDVFVSSIGQTHSEFIVDYDFILGWFASRGYKVWHDCPFTAFSGPFAAEYPSYRLTKGDMQFSALHRITVMEKK
jgi:hypothetical protein